MPDHRQLSLEITPRLAYSPDSFFLHSGVKSLHSDLVEILTQDKFFIALVRGASRSGKTHLSLSLADTVCRASRFPRLVDGAGFSSWVTDRLERSTIQKDEVIFVDDADLYLASLEPGSSGEFVNFVESCRVVGAKIVLFLNDANDQFRYDEHVASRILSGMEMQIQNPHEDEVERIADLLAKQRGMQLSPRKKGYLTKRIARDIASVERYLDRVARLAHEKGAPVGLPVLSEAFGHYEH